MIDLGGLSLFWGAEEDEVETEAAQISAGRSL